MVVQPRLALFAALITPVVLLVDGAPWLALLGVVAVVVLVWFLDWSLTAAPSQIGIARTVPSSVTLGRSGTLAWLVRNGSGKAASIRFAEGLAPSLRADSRRGELRLPPGRTATVETDIHPTRRGRFPLGELVIRVDGPLGFASRQQTRWIPSELRILPRFPSRAEAELRLRRSRLDMGLRSARMRGGGSEFEQLRDFTVDDEFRKIDWSATARADRMIVKTFRTERNQTVVNILDNGRLMAGQVADVPRSEHAMDAIMAVTTVATGLGDRTGLLVFDKTVRASVPASARSTQLSRLTNAMFDIEPELAESDYRGAFTETLLRFSRRTMLIIHTELLEQTVGEFLLPALPLLTRAHVVVIAAVRDPQVEIWATTSPDSVEDAHRHAAARASLAERQRTIAELRRNGATVVDAVPGKLAARLMDHYLDVKARGRL
ncbi:MAG: DUF58 domain-containing protein [Acidimicrobiia bacterium]|nr:DUF58 domain-containing protein [Acidimicrobiia bacterium]